MDAESNRDARDDPASGAFQSLLVWRPPTHEDLRGLGYGPETNMLMFAGKYSETDGRRDRGMATALQHQA